MACAKQSASQRRALRWAQSSLCAGCGRPLGSARKLSCHDPAYPTFDHIQPRSAGGRRLLANGLLKHRLCNQLRGNRKPSGCDILWLTFVTLRLAKRPRSFKSTFKGGGKNPGTLVPTAG